MKAVNLYLLTRVDTDIFQNTYKALANFEDSVHEQELLGIKKLLKKLAPYGLTVEDFDDFWYSYRIPHISKEFDLMKIEKDNLILNIELKSGEINTNRIKKQLIQNISYLKHFKTEILSFTYVSELDRLYFLKGGQLVKGEFEELAGAIKRFKGNAITEDLDIYFTPSIFLVSPLNHPERFINGEYFLTEQQKTYKSNIISSIGERNGIYTITGEPGTGKTLLMYDIARELTSEGSCLIIHGAELTRGHKAINDSSSKITIKTIEELELSDIEKYDFIFIDEMQRILDKTEKAILKYHETKNFILCYDEEQVLTADNHRSIRSELIRLGEYTEYKLTNLFRVNKHVAVFYKALFDLDAVPKVWESYTDIEVIYANDNEEANMIVDYYIKSRDYAFIRCSSDERDEIFGDKGYTTQQVIGLEYDRVLTVLDQSFYYDNNGKLCSRAQGKYDPVRLLYQNVTRTREKLCLLIIDNEKLYRKILKIRNHQL